MNRGTDWKNIAEFAVRKVRRGEWSLDDLSEFFARALADAASGQLRPSQRSTATAGSALKRPTAVG